MEPIVVLLLAVVLVGAVGVGVGSAFGRRRSSDELMSERGADESPDEGMGGSPIRDRPAGPGAESQSPDFPGEMHPPEQRGAPPDEVAKPSDAGGERDLDEER